MTEEKEIKVRCHACASSLWTLSVSPCEKPYVATLECMCGMASYFVISYPSYGVPSIIKKGFLKSDEYICAECCGVFEKGRTDEEAMELYKRQTGDTEATEENTECCCEDCWNKLIVPQLN